MEILPTDPDSAFDREFTLAELLHDVDKKRFHQFMVALLDGPAQVVDLQGSILLGELPPGVNPLRTPIISQLEPVGYLECDGSTKAAPMARLLEQVMRSSERYLMTSALHLEAVHADYERLKQQHTALQQSEQRYKELASTLDQQVQAQVEEIKHAHQQLLQSEKLTAVGQLASGVAHEINNPLGFILSNLTTAQGYMGDISEFLFLTTKNPPAETLQQLWQDKDLGFVLEDFDGLLKESVEGAQRVAKIVGDLRDFSEVDTTEMQEADLNSAITSVVTIAASRFGKGVKLAQRLANIPPVVCQLGHIRQILLNLLINSMDALKGEGGVIVVSSSTSPGEVVISVKDNGCGIAPEVMTRIFDPFFTTHEVGEGTGLGLSVAHDVMVAHGGRITVNSKLGEGTTMALHFPLAE